LPLATTFVLADTALHDLKNFDCGKASLNEYLSRYAMRNSGLGLSRTWVLTEQTVQAKAQVAAYFTLASSTVMRELLPAQTKSLPAYPVPVVLVARLAVSVHHQGQQLGAKTLVQALRTAFTLTERGLPALGVILDVLDDSALSFYQHMGLFTALTDQPMRLFISMGTIRQLL